MYIKITSNSNNCGVDMYKKSDFIHHKDQNKLKYFDAYYGSTPHIAIIIIPSSSISRHTLYYRNNNYSHRCIETIVSDGYSLFAAKTIKKFNLINSLTEK
jgi:hypothetical protein